MSFSEGGHTDHTEGDNTDPGLFLLLVVHCYFYKKIFIRNILYTKTETISQQIEL